ncbi:FkbM family methyltransferase [Stenotrophobium rhamnosiphilum]|uniref:FkbM family methyltransferase n=1 Tax=Stenotrophobium rhamnosiphilum TaxID=2029166 RepID=A0A2T5MK82_9GAMM|nr:FkbM family methyltransferase [Stenotrophobium rhamnosiphilum]PTU32991.1 FkbM family methyltransferase [Stenotrophobium rhamnosiphilum]
MKATVRKRVARIRTTFGQFSFLAALRVLAAEITRKLFDPHQTISYAQTGEDRILITILDRLGSNGNSGFYVDVGSNDPMMCSNTYALYRRGWRGLCVDANEELISKHQNIRKKDICVCAAISNVESELVFTYFNNPLVSSLDPAHVKNWTDWVGVKRTKVVKTRPLSSIFKERDIPSTFDILTIDIEGYDFEALTSFDLDQYRPKIIIIEMHGYDMTGQSPNKIYDYLKDHNYVMVGFAVMNGYFVDAPLRPLLN